MIAKDMRIRVADWKDPDFLLALQTVLTQTDVAGRDACRSETARRVQLALRASGYPEASVEYVGTADDVLSGIARWTVRRGHPTADAAR